jgi:hypothetical protein
MRDIRRICHKKSKEGRKQIQAYMKMVFGVIAAPGYLVILGFVLYGRM